MSKQFHQPAAETRGIADARGTGWHTRFRKEVCALMIWGIGLSAASAATRELTPRELYNQGSQSLEKGYLREAESCLLRAAGSNIESLQPPALYDLGHVRFRLGQELLKGEQPRQPMIDRAENARDDGQDAIREANRALQDDDLNHIIGAYNAGRGVRKQLRLANEETMRALDLYGAVLVRWKRSVGDFRSTVELRSDDHDAQFNADVVQRHIDELQKQMKELADKKEEVGKTRAELKKKLAELRKKIPDGMIQPGQGEPDDEDDEDEPKDPQKPDSGFKDELGREGEKRGITPEMAQQILEALGLKGDRKLPIGPDGKIPGGDEKTPPKNKKGKDW
jgi:tetratricopeptide (TPR) repeat protein